MTFSLSEHGEVFSTRPRGARLRAEALACKARGEDLTISFSGVRSISYSFADEFLGPIMIGNNKAVLEDIPPSLHRVIVGALKRRGVRTAGLNISTTASA